VLFEVFYMKDGRPKSLGAGKFGEEGIRCHACGSNQLLRQDLRSFERFMVIKAAGDGEEPSLALDLLSAEDLCL